MNVDGHSRFERAKTSRASDGAGDGSRKFESRRRRLRPRAKLAKSTKTEHGVRVSSGQGGQLHLFRCRRHHMPLTSATKLISRFRTSTPNDAVCRALGQMAGICALPSSRYAVSKVPAASDPVAPRRQRRSRHLGRPVHLKALRHPNPPNPSCLAQISNSTPISMICPPGILKYAPGRWAL